MDLALMAAQIIRWKTVREQSRWLYSNILVKTNINKKETTRHFMPPNMLQKRKKKKRIEHHLLELLFKKKKKGGLHPVQLTVSIFYCHFIRNIGTLMPNLNLNPDSTTFTHVLEKKWLFFLYFGLLTCNME